MATSNPKDALYIPMHKRIAMGEKLDGSSLQPKQPANNGGGLSQAKKK